MSSTNQVRTNRQNGCSWRDQKLEASWPQTCLGGSLSEKNSAKRTPPPTHGVHCNIDTGSPGAHPERSYPATKSACRYWGVQRALLPDTSWLSGVLSLKGVVKSTLQKIKRAPMGRDLCPGLPSRSDVEALELQVCGFWFIRVVFLQNGRECFWSVSGMDF